MQFESLTLQAPLNSYVESIFYYNGFIPDHSIERVVPTGHLFVIFELDGFPRNTFDNNTLKPVKTFRRVWISGMHNHYLSISAHQDSEMFVIQFKPYGSFPFLHIPVDQLNNKVLQGEELLGDEIINIRDQILQAADVDQKFRVAEDWLNSRFDLQKTPEKEIVRVIQKLMQSPIAEHHEIIKSYSKTQKHLINQFKKYCGLTPKLLHRIMRFNEVLQKINQKEKLEWSYIAYHCGFSDQSHFIKEFKEFSGFNPQEFVNMNMHQKETNFFPLDGEE